MAKVAIVILNWNGQQMLAKYLPNVVEYSRQDAEIWVADNSSSDQSMLLLETQFPHVKTIVLEQNFGFAEGYNRALKEIEAEYYVLLNSDVEVSHHWLTPLIEFMDSHRRWQLASLSSWRNTTRIVSNMPGLVVDSSISMVTRSVGGASSTPWSVTMVSMITSRKCSGPQVPA